jgi:hypothetical protein
VLLLCCCCAAVTECALSWEEFKSSAHPIDIVVGDHKATAVLKHFSSGSFGWSVQENSEQKVDGKPITVRISANATVLGSKQKAAKDKADAQKEVTLRHVLPCAVCCAVSYRVVMWC